jgi:hypothetical protein
MPAEHSPIDEDELVVQLMETRVTNPEREGISPCPQS